MKQKVWGVSLGLMLCAGALYAGNETKPAQKAGEEAKLKSIEAVENNRTVENELKVDIQEMYRMYGIDGGDGHDFQ